MYLRTKECPKVCGAKIPIFRLVQKFIKPKLLEFPVFSNFDSPTLIGLKTILGFFEFIKWP